MPRTLTKSRFKLALECPARLYYTSKRNEYADNKLENEFLLSLAEGGFQVGELAKCYYPAPEENNIDTLDYNEALRRTRALLVQENVIIYEAAFAYKNLFIRADILVKTGDHFKLIEVKSKSYNEEKIKYGFYNKDRTSIDRNWKPYLYDVAFQKFVMLHYLLENGFPEPAIESYLMLADKAAVATVDGLNQYFFFDREERRVIRDPTLNYALDALGEPILTTINVDQVVNDVWRWELDGRTFEETIFYWADQYEQDHRIWSLLGGQCGACEFKATPEQKAQGLKSGFEECWRHQAGFSDADFEKPSVLDIWDFRKKQQYITDQKYFQEQLTRADLESRKPKETRKTGLVRVDRQWLQIEKSVSGDRRAYVDKEGLLNEMQQWQFPLHMIDFETSAAAIPFHRGLHPYEQVAFQFSHHIIYENGKTEHKDQWLCAEPGRFPNFTFVRALKEALEQDDGIVFRYSHHENTILNKIAEQLQNSDEADRNELCAWIDTLTQKDGTAGPRNMVDLCEMIKRFYYHPAMNGSNSIKAVLPAILNNSIFLQKKYAQPVYGSTEIPSLNFQNKAWIERNPDGSVKDPYKTLPPIFDPGTDAQLEGYFVDEEAGIQNGGAAMTAYAKMQFTRMTDAERGKFSEALLKYCELDTLAMVMIWEEFCRLIL